MDRLSSFAVFAVFACTAGYYPPPTSAQSQPQYAPSDHNVIDDAAEHKAYLAALHTQNPFTVEAFITRYPESSAVREILEHLIAPYLEPQNRSDGYSSADAKVLELAQRLRELAPDDVRALAVITTLDRKRVTNGLKDANNEMCANSQSGLERLPGWQAPEKMSIVEIKRTRMNMADTFNGAAGFCAFLRKDFATARSFYEKALRLNPVKLEDIYQLTRTDLDMKPLDPKGFWYCGRVIQLLEPGHQRSEEFLAKYCQARYRQFHGTEDGWAQIVKQAAAENTVPGNFAWIARNPAVQH